MGSGLPLAARDSLRIALRRFGHRVLGPVVEKEGGLILSLQRVLREAVVSKPK